jgi:hypothetical protein
MNQLSAHIAKTHPRPGPRDLRPTLVHKRKALTKQTAS